MSETILATEFWADYHLVADPSNGNVCKSHRTVSGYVQIINGGTDLVKDLAGQPPKTTHQRVTSLVNPPTIGGALCSLDWVGRNHGSNSRGANGKLLGTTNFLYCDGHVETKVIEDTLKPFQWGEQTYIYSVQKLLWIPL